MSVKLAAALALAAFSARAEAPKRIIEIAWFHVPAEKVGQVPAAQERLYRSLSKYPGFISGRSFQSVKEPTDFVDYVTWDTLENAEGAVARAFQDPEIGAAYFTLMDKVPFYGHAAGLEDAAPCAEPATKDGEVLALQIVGAKRDQAAKMAQGGPALASAIRGAAHAQYSEVSRFIEYPEFFLSYSQYGSAEAGKAAQRALSGDKSAAQFFGSVNMAAMSGHFKQLRAVSARCEAQAAKPG